MNGKYLLNRRDSKIMGVAAGLADWTGTDVLAVRLILVVAALVFPVTILLYIVTGWLAADR